MTFPQARPTTYKGIQMRSRLEAKYAAQFDDEGFAWEYEPRAFASQRGQYLPDFLVHASEDIYVEVKPTLAQAMAVLSRIEIIRESLPDAVLMVIAQWEGAYLLLMDEAKWRWFPNR